MALDEYKPRAEEKDAIPIPGTKNKEHLVENLKAAEIKLSGNIIKEIDSLY